MDSFHLSAYTRDYKECSQFDEPRVQKIADFSVFAPKSELIRDFKSELMTQLFFGAPESETKFEPPKRFFTALLVLHSAFCFYPLPLRVELRLPSAPLGNRTPG
ncbi:hypothetical protein AVEN_92750-1 [Araneus ventricosus]|uniref:Uncharacterized protein n=1 Tax=Araneus ventricosus TaxID=182803 RepID=A0A4Y2KFT0_ARAVE|nr:hypothetical protein AVEN_92750-1 [Araneus ventricosus]